MKCAFHPTEPLRLGLALAGPRRKLPFGTGRGLAAPHAFSIRPWDGYYNSVVMNSPSAR